MISKAKLKYIHSLEQKRIRREDGLYVAEGPKVVGDLLAHGPARTIVATREWLRSHEAQVASCGEVIEVTDDELRRASLLQHPQQVLALMPLPEAQPDWHPDPAELTLALDGVQDPGNVGTIIRVADWFGIRHMVCSTDTADAFNPKVVQATMGSLARVHIYYRDLTAMLDAMPADYPVYGLLLDGNDIYREQLTAHGMIVMGNEGKGLSAAMRQRVTRRLLIPSYPATASTAESLNVAVATAVTCAEFRRRSD